MDFWTVASYAAWIISAAIFLWMLWDAFMVGRRYDEAAKTLKVKEATLATRLHRARRAVVQQLTTSEPPEEEPRRSRTWGARP